MIKPPVSREMQHKNFFNFGKQPILASHVVETWIEMNENSWKVIDFYQFLFSFWRHAFDLSIISLLSNQKIFRRFKLTAFRYEAMSKYFDLIIHDVFEP